MSSVYGGGSVATFPSISESFAAKHPYRNFMYLSKDFNPSAPTMAGRPGLFFTHDKFWLRDADARPGKDANLPEWAKVPQRVFTRLSSGCWLYCGQYLLTFCRAITTEEWNSRKMPNVRALFDL